MGKPPPSFQNVSIATVIAQTVCKPSASKLDLVARSGCCSVFEAVSEIYAPCVRDDVANRDGISECQLNKALQKAGCKRVRDRRSHVSKRAEDPTGTGMYLFSNMRWRDPARSDDRADLTRGYDAIVERFPRVAKECSLARFLEVVGRFQSRWEASAESMSGACSFEVEADEDSDCSARHTPTHMPASISITTEILSLQVALATARTVALLQARVGAPAASVPIAMSMAPLTSNITLPPISGSVEMVEDQTLPEIDLSLNAMSC